MDEVKDKVVLIGMPGCGKTTIGKVLANDLNYNFYDMDAYIEKIANKTIKELFAEGEEVFRSYETRACIELSKKKRVIISSGGGVVKKQENMEILSESCIIVFIDRPVDEIAKDVDVNSRPLLKDGKDKLYKLYDERYELYKKYSHITVKNEGFLKEVVDKMRICLKNKIRG